MTEVSSGSESLKHAAGEFAVCVRSLSEPTKGSPRDFCCEELFPAASVIKVGILQALLYDVHEGRYSLDREVFVESEQMVGGAGVLFELEPRSYQLGELARLMMVVSDNTASNACLRQVGVERVNRFFRERGLQAFMGREFMSPVVNGQDNKLTAEAAALMLADLYSGRNLNDALTEFAVGCLRRQQFREKIPLMLPADLSVGHKTGELEGVRHDAAVIEAEEPYILVILTAAGGQPWMVDRAMAEYSLEVYRERVEQE